ncbi:hypothetical protein KIH75_04830 [Bifidobacterium sp. 64T4]|uniref:hypothetical protein n=1 Tax=Bifidobacterium pongonis TaxID=2834432 RepID=UPI001C55BB06|nr:hypothetical protein [Bifidobacterium pongonis]MBW3094674.1 hypothetical protein [Bifidobacterium pongonis]
MGTGNSTGAARLKRIAAMIATTAMLVCGCALTSVPARAQDGTDGTTSNDAAAAAQATQLAQEAAEQSAAEQGGDNQAAANGTSQSTTGQTATDQSSVSMLTNDAPLNTSLDPQDPNEKSPEPIGMGQRVGLGRTGVAKVVALRVDFPDQQFAQGDSLEALQSLIDGTNQGSAPYDNLNSYYQRSSYGKLSFTGQAFDYHATRNRSEYGSAEEVILEALRALDATVDFSQFDGNDDGRIDLVYMHFAGPNTGWHGMWWSYETNASEGLTFDGKELCNIATLHQPSNTTEGAKTIIHETGHALGLADYYASPTSTTTPNKGMGTDDIMNNNIGDHCGFSKWLLGWIDDDHVTRIVVRPDGVTVKRGNADVEHMASVSQAVTSLNYNDMRQQGSIVAISADPALLGPKGKFSSYYVLQYDDAVGNQIVMKHSALRLYRVQAELGDNGIFTHSNISSTEAHNKLIELVDMTEAPDHGDSGNLRQGDHINGSTMPSTNFQETAAAGFTGIDLTVTNMTALGATVSITYNDSGQTKPDEFAITDTLMSRGIIGADSYQLKASARVVKADPYSRATITVDGKDFDTRFSVDGDTITLDYRLPAGTLSTTSSCSFTFPEGTFIIGTEDGKSITSKSITVPVKVGPVENIEKTGTYAWRGKHSYDISTTSHMFSDDQGNQYMAVRIDATLYIVSFSDTDLAAPTVKEIPLAEGRSPVSDFSHISLRNNILEATFDTFSPTAVYLTYWIDMPSGKVIAHSGTAQPAQSFLRVGDSILYVTKYDYTGSETVMQTPQSDGTVNITSSKGVAQLLETQNGMPAIVPLTGTGAGYDTDPVTGKEGRSILFVQSEALERAILSRGNESSTAQEPWTYDIVPSTRSVFIAQTYDVQAAIATDDATYAVTLEPENAMPRYFITRFDTNGKQTKRLQLNDPSLSDENYSNTLSLQASSNGYLALVNQQRSDLTSERRTITTLLSPDMATMSVSGTDSWQQATGWLCGRWAYVALDTDETGAQLDYAMTKILDTSSPVTPSDPGKPGKPSTPGSQPQGNAANAAHTAKTLTRTGAAAPFMLAAALALAGITVLAVAKTGVSPRRQRE